jgi:hypothetical protein
MGVTLAGESKFNDAKNAPTLPDQRQRQSDANTLDGAGLAVVGIGAALVVAPIIVLAVTPKRRVRANFPRLVATVAGLRGSW